MKIKLTLALLSCLVMFAYVSHGKQKQGQPIEAAELDNMVLSQQNSFSQEPSRELPPTVNAPDSLQPPAPFHSSPYPTPQQTYSQTKPTWEREPYMQPPRIVLILPRISRLGCLRGTI
ncbi:hypothetical protein [Cyanothece sp. BG0011]|uniref:hypothetical protein n=1 Tax=Cyanothece sp. BG0011 TaxID=2082950 RepID=UPI0018E5151E|nr:hypothetical protein [Cyanothece sp. BG0011]